VNNPISKIQNDAQDRTALVWKRLCEWVEEIAAENREEFVSFDELGPELFVQVYTSPANISKFEK
jgi:hypothetical protein